MAEDPEKRKIFIDSLSEFLDMYAFEGVDLDWVSTVFPHIVAAATILF